MPEPYTKFRPENITPDHFMQPPTEALRSPIAALTFLQEKAINQAAAHVARERYPHITAAPVLRIGSEFEILLFSDASDPSKDKMFPNYTNPNYSTAHRHAIRELNRSMHQSGSEGLSDILYNEADHLGRIITEIRTSPADVRGYFEATDRIRSWFQRYAGRYNINPVVWSQHLHLSLIDPLSGVNVLDDKTVENAVGKGILDMYHRAMPLLRLPENVEDSDIRKMTTGFGWGIYTKGFSNIRNDPLRVEGRMNNSDYAADPYLNLLINLIGVKRGLRHFKDHREIDKDFPLEDTADPEYAYFTIGEGYTSFQGSLYHLLTDKVLAEEFSPSLLRNIYTIVHSYPDISRGRVNLSDARARAYDIVDFT